MSIISRFSTTLKITAVAACTLPMMQAKSWTADCPAGKTAVDAMKGNTFAAMGVTRTMWEFYRGMGLAVTVFLTLAAVVLWQMAVLAKTEMFPLLRPVLGAFVLGFLMMAVVSWQYFFVAPVVTELLIAVCVGMAMVPAKALQRSGVEI